MKSWFSRGIVALFFAFVSGMAGVRPALGGNIEGHVTAANGVSPLPGINVQPYRQVVFSFGSYFEYVSGVWDTTDASGNFSLTGLTGGNYRIQFTDPAGDYARETFNDVSVSPSVGGTIVSVTDTGTTSGVNVSLAAAAHIEGTVTASTGGAPISGAAVRAYRWAGSDYEYVSEAATDVSGDYSIGGLPAGLYRVRFEDAIGALVTEVYSNFFGEVWEGGQTLSLSAAQTATGIDAALDAASSISGNVTAEAGGAPLAGIGVFLYRWTGTYWGWQTSTDTDAAGDYQFTGLPSGSYRIQFYDFFATYVGESYDDVLGEAADVGTDIALGTGMDVTGIDAALALGSTLAGTVTELDGVTGIEYVFVLAYQWTGLDWVYRGNGGFTDANGDYLISGLPAGTYRVEFSSSDGLHSPEYYDDAPELTNATDIIVAAESSVSGIDASLALYGSLAGTVTAADGVTPLPGIRVVARRSNDNGVASTDLTDALGHFTILELSPGDYYLHADPSGDGLHLGEWHPGMLYVPGYPAPGGATVISLASGDALTGYDLSVNDAGRIGGTVTGAGLLALTNAAVIAYGNTYIVRADTTDSNGVYSLRGLPPDSYQLRAGAEGFHDEWWQNADDSGHATAVVVGEGDLLTRDFNLAPGQGPALVEIVSDPAGAQIYVDYQATTNVTPATLDIGEIGGHDALGQRLAPRTVTVKKAGHPRPALQPFDGVEGETASLFFDLTATNAGALSVQTTPAGADVFVDTADATAGLSPVIVTNLAPGSHVILLRKAGYLQPRPILAWVTNATTNAVSLPLVATGSTERFIADARSVPPGAAVYVDYLATPSVTDVVLDGMDAASYAGIGWESRPHTLMLRKPGFRDSAPRYIEELTNVAGIVRVNLHIDAVEATDGDHDGLPDEWQQAYGLDTLPPQDAGPGGDPDGDGISNEDEFRTGTDPRSANSAFEVEGVPVPNGQNLSVTFDTVPGRSYIVLCTASLTQPWAQASGVIVATGLQTTWATVLPQLNACLYFKIIVLSP